MVGSIIVDTAPTCLSSVEATANTSLYSRHTQILDGEPAHFEADPQRVRGKSEGKSASDLNIESLGFSLATSERKRRNILLSA